MKNIPSRIYVVTNHYGKSFYSGAVPHSFNCFTPDLSLAKTFTDFLSAQHVEQQFLKLGYSHIGVLSFVLDPAQFKEEV